MSLSFTRAFLTGSIVAPLVTKFFIIPMYFNPKEIMREVHYIQQEMDYVGWNLRRLEEEKGISEEDLYVPATYYRQS